MNKRQISDDNMSSTVLEVLDENSSIIAGNQPILDEIDVLKDIKKDIDKNAVIQQETTKGATIEEYLARIDAANKCEKLMLGLRPYYLLQDNITDLAMVNKPYSALIYNSRTKSLDIMKLVAKKAGLIPIASLASFGIVAIDITKSKDANDKFEASMPKNRTIKSSMKTATSELKTLFKQQKLEFKKLDILMGPFKISNSGFWKTYTNARILVKIGAGQTAESIILGPLAFVPIFENKIKAGYTITVKNPNSFPVALSLTNTPNEYAPQFVITLEENTERRISIPEDFNNVLGNYLMLFNPNKYNKIKITAILAKGPSHSGAPELVGHLTS
jgi:hypothetical protein